MTDIVRNPNAAHPANLRADTVLSALRAVGIEPTHSNCQFAVVETKDHASGTYFKHGEQFAIPRQTRNHGILWDIFTVGTTRDYLSAIFDTEAEVEAAVQRSIDNGHEQFWAMPEAAVVSDMVRPYEIVRERTFGSVIRLAGRAFRIEPASNNNVKLVEIDEQ